MPKYESKIDILIAKAKSMYEAIVNQKVSTDLALEIRRGTAFDRLDRDAQMTVCKIVVESEKAFKVIDSESEVKAANGPATKPETEAKPNAENQG